MTRKKIVEEELDEPVNTGRFISEEELDKDDDENETNQQSETIDKNQTDKSQEYLEMAQRIQAEFDNYRRRNMDLAKNSRQDGIMFAAEQLLPVVDTISSAKKQVTDENFLKSLELIYKQALDCFAKLGVTKIEALGKPFNPVYHNAILAEEVEGTEPDMVIDEFQEGFMLGDRVIRHSVVKVSK